MKTQHITANLPHFQPAYVANGFVGLRVGRIPLPRGTALVSGFVGVSPEKGTEEYADAPYPVGGDLQLGRTWLSERPDLAALVSQEYDFACGELRSRFAFRGPEATAQVEVLTFCSRTQPTLVLQETLVEVDKPAALVLQANIDPRGLAGRLTFISMPGRDDRLRAGRDKDGILEWESRGALGRLGIAYATEFSGDDLQDRVRNNYGHEQDMMLTNYTVAAQPGKRYRLRQITSLVPSLLHPEPHWQASRHAGAGVWLGFDQLRAQNRAAWAELWQGRPLIHADDSKWQDLADAAFFYLHSSVHQATPCSIAPFGLSRRCEYSGHVFWDCETFMFPPVLLTAPDAARGMLDYRSRILPAARDNAKLNGYRGIQFPWQTGNSGAEVTPYYAGAAGGITEQHINLDVAFAFAQYVHASGDELFLRQQAWPVLAGVADWITSRVTRTTRGYEIRHITGPDEGLDNIHNNAYTNMAAIVVLREAIAMARRLGFPPPVQWGDIERGMFLPIDPATHVMLKHDAYRYEGGMCVPETMGGFFPFTYSHSPAVDKATAQYHLKLAESYLGMPMFSALYAVWACREGERDLARRFFELGIETHLVEPYLQFNEVAHVAGANFLGACNDKTVFLTNPAGFLMSLLFGLTGLQLDSGDPQGWGKFPIVLPAGWERIDVARIWVRGRPARLSARHGAPRAELAFADV